jgi:hypothetical protein
MPESRDCMMSGPRLAGVGTLEAVSEIMEKKTDCSLDEFLLSSEVKGFELTDHLQVVRWFRGLRSLILNLRIVARRGIPLS